MREFVQVHIEGNDGEERNRHPAFVYQKQELVPRSEEGATVAAVYTVPPGKAAFPYHYHLKNEESYYILAGTGALKTPTGEKAVSAGDFLFFPAGEAGAHKLMNTGAAPLTYLNIDAAHDLDVAIYPDSGKIGVWGKGVNKVFQTASETGYYEGEE